MNEECKVLVIDDEASARSNLRSFLEMMEYRVVEACNGLDGLDLFHREHPDLVMTDLQMPGIGGLKLIAMLGAISPDTPVIVVSGAGTVRDAIAAARLGAWDYVLKPVSQSDELELAIRRARDRARLISENRRYQANLEQIVAARSRELQRSEEMLRRLVDMASDSIFTVNDEGIVVSANREVTNMFGYELSDVLGKPAAGFIPPLSRVFQQGMSRRIEPQGGSLPTGVVQEVDARKKDGSPLPVELSVSEWRIANDRYYTVIARDISARKKAEQELIRGRSELDGKHRELKMLFDLVDAGKREWEETMDCVDDMVILADAKGLIRRTNKTFLKLANRSYHDVIGRDVREVLRESGIELDAAENSDGVLVHRETGRWLSLKQYRSVGSSEGLPGTVITIHDAAAVRKMAWELEQKHDEARKALEELRTAQRQPALRGNACSHADRQERSLADINQCIEASLNIVRNELKRKAAVKYSFGELPRVPCYPQRLQQVFMILLVNASHAIETRGEISIRTWSGNDAVYVSISDNGCGIPASNIGRIFDPFFATKEGGQGADPGLSIASEIVKKHDGEILFESEVGKGTTFTVRIPILRGGAPPRGAWRCESLPH